MAGMFDMMKKAQDMQRQMQSMQKEMTEARFLGQAGGGAVKVEVSGDHLVHAVTISPDALDDASMLEDMVKVATNEAIHMASTEAEKRMKAITGGLKIPGLN